MLSRLLLATVGLAALSTAAAAADLPSRRAPPVYVAPPVPVFTWTGAYIGVNAGYAFDTHQANSITGNDPVTAGGIAIGSVAPYVRNNSSGFTGGGQIGYNYELGNGLGALGGSGVVIGVEADAAYTDLSSTTDTFGVGGFDTRVHSRVQYVGTARGRLGYAFNNFLLYGTGGFAYGGLTGNTAVLNAAGTTGYTGGHDSIRTGYAYGGGVEYALPTSSFVNFFQASAVTLKAEFIHYDLGSSSYLSSGIAAVAATGSFTVRERTEGNLIRGGLNYKFGAVPVPVVARY